MAEMTLEEKRLYRLRTFGFWISIAIGFIVLQAGVALGQAMWVAFIAALVVMLLASRILPWYREVQRSEGGRKPPAFSMMLTQGIAFGAILYLLQTLWNLI